MPYFLKGIVSYIGTSYFGFQKQPNKLTVAGVLENSLKIIYKRPVKVLAAGRTDRGVHASGQVIAIKVDIYIDSERLLKAINSLLPVDITFISLDYTDKCFHPIQSAVARCYEYYVCSTQLPFYLSPFVLNYKFSDIIQKVASKGGTTEEGLKVLSKKNNLFKLFEKAVLSAEKKSKKISKKLK